MKHRIDFITNSSSSSFIIAAKDVDYNFLLNTVLKDFYVTREKRWDDNSTDVELANTYNVEDVINNSDSSLQLCIKSKWEIEEENYYYHKWHEDKNSEENKEQFYVIYNGGCIRFNWDDVKAIFTDKYNINWAYGNCD